MTENQGIFSKAWQKVEECTNLVIRQKSMRKHFSFYILSGGVMVIKEKGDFKKGINKKISLDNTHVLPPDAILFPHVKRRHR